MLPQSDTFYLWAPGSLCTLLTLSDKKALLLILFSYQPNTGMFLKVHNRPSGVCGGGHYQSDPRNSILSSPTTVKPTSALDSPTAKAAKEKVISVLLVWQSAQGVRLIAAPFLSTWTRTKVGSLRLSMILACGLLHQLVSALGGSESGGREDTTALTDIQYTQLKPQTGKSNNIISMAGSQFIYYPICPPAGGGWEYGNSSQSSNARIWNLGTRRVRRLRGMIIGNQIERWGNCLTTTTIMSVPD